MTDNVISLDDAKSETVELTPEDDAVAVENEVEQKPVRLKVKGEVFEFPHIATWKPGAIYALRNAAKRQDNDSIFGVIDALSFVLPQATFERLLSLDWEDLVKVIETVFKQFGLTQGE